MHRVYQVWRRLTLICLYNTSTKPFNKSRSLFHYTSDYSVYNSVNLLNAELITYEIEQVSCLLGLTEEYRFKTLFKKLLNKVLRLYKFSTYLLPVNSA